MKAVRYDNYGGLDVLRLEEVDLPVPSSSQYLVKVKAAGINPGEAAIREGKLAAQYPSTFPSGQGSDFAGIIETAGSNTSKFQPGDEVIGFTNNRASHAEYVLAEESQLVKKPANVSWEQAGSLFVAGTTAWAAVSAVTLESGDTLVVSGAAGGVGSLVVQLAVSAGARVIGIAGPGNHKWLGEHGILPIAYGDDLKEKILSLTDGKVDAFIDTFGQGYVDLALELGVPAGRINTIIDFAAAARHGVKTDGSAKAANTAVLEVLASLLASGKLEIIVAASFPLSEVKEAYRELEKRHTHGKIVLVP